MNFFTDNRWAYTDDGSGRDQRIDFIRGMVMLSLVVGHIAFFSIYNLVIWERIGVVSGGEGFVILSGLVIGMIYSRKIERDGWGTAINKLVDRAVQLYRLNVTVVVGVLALTWIPFFSAEKVMSFTDQYAKVVYPLYPAASATIQEWIGRILLLKCGPHQFQIIGLYVVLLIASPIALWLMYHKRTQVLLGLSWILYIYNWAWPKMPSGAQFEYGFPLLTWQLIYFHGMAAGYHRKRIGEIMETAWRKPILIVTGVLTLVFLFFTQNNPNPEMPSWAKLSLIPADTFMSLYMKYFQKNTLGILRLVNYFCLLVTGYWLLTKYWKLLDQAFGWFFVPMGQATLYVFILHVFVLYILGNIPIFWEGHFWLNTLGHTAVLGLLWFMVRRQVFFKWIPR